MSAFLTRLSNDLKADLRKTLLLCGLTLALCYFAIPPLWLMVPNAAPAAVVTTPSSSSPSIAAPKTPNSELPASKAISTGWKHWEALRSSDHLFTSAEPTVGTDDPFRIAGDRLPLTVELVHEDPEAPVTAPTQIAAQEPSLPEISLQSTLVSSSRRVAVIDGGVYLEGGTLTVGESLWTLLSVEPRRVLLSDGLRTTELRLNPFGTREHWNTP